MSADLVKAYAGEEADVGMHDIGNALAEAWSSLSVAKVCLKESFVTDTDESLTKIVNKKYGPVTQETMM